MLKLIVAVDSGNAIGWSDGRLPWHVPEDLKRFKNLTTGGSVIMGWNTFKSLGRPSGLPNRRNIVLTRKALNEARQYAEKNIDIISSLVWVQASQECLGCTPPDYWVIGGASVYEQVIKQQLVDEIYLTLVHTASNADVVLPFDLAAWKLFVLQQGKIGVKWHVINLEESTSLKQSTCTFITLKKFK